MRLMSALHIFTRLYIVVIDLRFSLDEYMVAARRKGERCGFCVYCAHKKKREEGGLAGIIIICCVSFLWF